MNRQTLHEFLVRIQEIRSKIGERGPLRSHSGTPGSDGPGGDRQMTRVHATEGTQQYRAAEDPIEVLSMTMSPTARPQASGSEPAVNGGAQRM